MRISASTVFGVGSRMSISRLWVRISKCSRESLYLCGERMTQYTFFSVGSGTGPTTLAPVRMTVSYDLARRGINGLMVVGLEPDADLLSRHASPTSLPCPDPVFRWAPIA